MTENIEHPRKQLNLFTDYECGYCGASDVSPKNPDLFDGFLDADTGDIVCRSCKAKHYEVKRQGEHGGKYTEMPVLAKNHPLKRKR